MIYCTWWKKVGGESFFVFWNTQIYISNWLLISFVVFHRFSIWLVRLPILFIWISKRRMPSILRGELTKCSKIKWMQNCPKFFTSFLIRQMLLTVPALGKIHSWISDSKSPVNHKNGDFVRLVPNTTKNPRIFARLKPYSTYLKKNTY